MHGGRSQHSSSRFFQDALSYLVTMLLSLFRLIKIAFFGPAPPELSHKCVRVYLSLQTKSIVSSCTSDFSLDLYPGVPTIKEHPYEIHEALGDSSAIIPSHVSLIYPSWYRPLLLSPILHNFLWNIASTSLGSTKNLKTWLLKNIFRFLRISLTILR